MIHGCKRCNPLRPQGRPAMIHEGTNATFFLVIILRLWHDFGMGVSYPEMEIT
jgi:hypothetical protein